MNNRTDHDQIIKEELRRAGVSRYGLRKAESRYLLQLLHPQETIKAAMFGRTLHGGTLLVATNTRVLSLNCKLMFASEDEIGYDAVSGIHYGASGPFAEVTLYTRNGSYALSYVNKRAAERFVHFIESKRIENPAFFGTPMVRQG